MWQLGETQHAMLPPSLRVMGAFWQPECKCHSVFFDERRWQGKDVVVCSVGWSMPHKDCGRSGNKDLESAWLSGMDYGPTLNAVEVIPEEKVHVVVDCMPFCDPFQDKD